MSALAERILAAFGSLGPGGEVATEDVVYQPSGGSERTITALVDRERPDGFLSGRVYPFEVTVINDAAEGIDPSVVDCGVDNIKVAERFGGTPVARGIQQIVEQDSEFVTFSVK